MQSLTYLAICGGRRLRFHSSPKALISTRHSGFTEVVPAKQDLLCFCENQTTHSACVRVVIFEQAIGIVKPTFAYCMSIDQRVVLRVLVVTNPLRIGDNIAF
jgi:hypothetical protein